MCISNIGTENSVLGGILIKVLAEIICMKAPYVVTLSHAS